MSNEIATVPGRTSPAQGYTFTAVETQAEIIEAIDLLYEAGCARIGLVTIQLGYKSEENGATSVLASERAKQGSAYLLGNIRPLVRRTDRVFLYQQSCYFLLLDANLQGAEIVEERLWEALLWRVHNMGEQEALRPARLEIGHGALPDPHASSRELLSAASEFSKHFAWPAERERVRQRAASNSVREGEQAQSAPPEDLSSLAKKLGIPYLTPLPRRLPQRVLQVLNARLARELRCYPVGRERNMLTVAMLNPQDRHALERLHQETGLRIFPVLTHPEALEAALKHFK